MGKVHVASLLKLSTFPLRQLMSALEYNMLDGFEMRKVSITVSMSTRQVFEMASDSFIKNPHDSCRV